MGCARSPWDLRLPRSHGVAESTVRGKANSRFRVGPVMTTSVPLHCYPSSENSWLITCFFLAPHGPPCTLHGAWRRERDSNPRSRFCRNTRFPIVPLQPLGHLSATSPTSFKQYNTIDLRSREANYALCELRWLKDSFL